MDKKKRMMEALTHYNNVFSVIANITNEDFERIAILYENLYDKEFKKSGNYHKGDPYYITTLDKLAMLRSVYEVVKNNNNYHGVLFTLEKEYEKELNHRLERTVYSYGEATDEKYQAPYSIMPEYSLILADMCSRQMQETQNQLADAKEVIIPKSSFKTFETIKGDLTKVGISIPKKDVEISNRIGNSIRIEQEKKANKIIRQKLQREWKMQELQQHINSISNQILEIQQKINGVIEKTIGINYSSKITKQFPEDSQKFEQLKEQINEYKKQNNTSFVDLKKMYDKVCQDLTFYQEVLPVFEVYEQRFETIQANDKQDIVQKNDDRNRTNLYYRAENKRLQDSKSPYTAYDLGYRLPMEYANLNYDELNNRLVQEQRKKLNANNEQEIRKQIIMELIKSQYGNFANNVSDVQYKNLSQEYDSFSIQELQTRLSQQNKSNEITVQPINLNQNLIINEFDEIISPKVETKGIKEVFGGITGVEVRDREKDLETITKNFTQQPKKELQPLDFSSVLTDVERKNLIREILELENLGMKFETIPQQYIDKVSDKSIDELYEYKDSLIIPKGKTM